MYRNTVHANTRSARTVYRKRDTTHTYTVLQLHETRATKHTTEMNISTLALFYGSIVPDRCCLRPRGMLCVSPASGLLSLVCGAKRYRGLNGARGPSRGTRVRNPASVMQARHAVREVYHRHPHPGFISITGSGSIFNNQ